MEDQMKLLRRKMRMRGELRGWLSIVMGIIAYRTWQFVLGAMGATTEPGPYEPTTTTWVDVTATWVAFFAIIYCWHVLEKLFGDSEDLVRVMEALRAEVLALRTALARAALKRGGT